MNKKQTFFTALLFLTSILACVVPGLQTASVPAPAPTADTGRLATIVAETVSAARVQTEQARPTATATLKPTSTPTETPTKDLGPAGSELILQEDSSTLFVDGRAEYQVTIPFGWLAVRVNEQEYLDAFALPAANEFVQKSLLSIQNQDPNIFRLYSFDIREDHVQKGFVTNVNFVWDEQGSTSFATDDELKAIAAQSVEALPGREILSTKLLSTTNAVPFGLIESKFAAKNSSGKDIVVFQEQAVFNVKTGALVITLSTVDELKDTVFPEFDTMLETIKLTVE